jgi:hypothetical protein
MTPFRSLKWNAEQKKKTNAAGPALFWEKFSPTKCGTLQNGICIHVWTWPKHTWMSGVYLHISLQNGSWISHHILTIWQGFIYKKYRSITFRGVWGGLL